MGSAGTIEVGEEGLPDVQELNHHDSWEKARVEPGLVE